MLGVEKTVAVGSAIADDAVGKFDGVDDFPGIVGAKEAAPDLWIWNSCARQSSLRAVCHVDKIVFAGNNVQPVENDAAVAVAFIAGKGAGKDDVGSRRRFRVRVLPLGKVSRPLYGAAFEQQNVLVGCLVKCGRQCVYIDACLFGLAHMAGQECECREKKVSWFHVHDDMVLRLLYNQFLAVDDVEAFLRGGERLSQQIVDARRVARRRILYGSEAGRVAEMASYCDIGQAQFLGGAQAVHIYDQTASPC